jgi:CRISPR-associated protein Csh2
MTEQDQTVENRSEIVFVYDAVDCNPNGNPLSAGDRPRIDPQTQQAIVTDVRLKRYLRDQLDEDGHGVYIRNVKEEGYQATREDLLRDRVKNVDYDDYDDDEEYADAIYGEFLDNSADVRYFGATMSVDTDDDNIADALPDHFTGPVQFSPGKTMNAVNENENYDSLTSVIATQEEKEQGGFGLDDHRIQYGLIAFHGLVDENGAEDTNLKGEDVRRLDTLCWRALKNQTVTRSKVGQEPRLYIRVEYADDSYHIGGLQRSLSLGEGSKPDDELRSIDDLELDITEVVERLNEHSDRIEKVRVTASDVVEFRDGDETGDEELLHESLENAVGDDEVDMIDVYDEFNSQAE